MDPVDGPILASLLGRHAFYSSFSFLMKSGDMDCFKT